MNPSLPRRAEMAIASAFLRDLRDEGMVSDFGRRLVEMSEHYFRDFASVAVFDMVNLSTGRYSAISNRPEAFIPVQPAISAYIHQNPSWAYVASGGTDRVLMITDFLSERQWMRTELYNEVFKVIGARHQVSVSLSLPGYISGLTLNGDHAAGVEARVLLHRLAPYIIEAHAAALRGRSPVFLFSRADPGALGLTEIEMLVLRGLASGRSDADIGEVMALPPRAVRRHVERILEKLQVYTRVGAVERAREILAA